jgi:hypothetical protein
MKKFTTVDKTWDNAVNHVVTPEKCLAATIKNDGGSLVRINDSILLKPGHNYQVDAIPGYYYESRIDLKIVNTNSPYNEITVINFRYAVEI